MATPADWIDSVLSARGRGALPYRGESKWGVRQHLLDLVQVRGVGGGWAVPRGLELERGGGRGDGRGGVRLRTPSISMPPPLALNLLLAIVFFFFSFYLH